MIIGMVSLWILLLYFLTLKPISLADTGIQSHIRRGYNVNSKPVNFIDELEDAVYFSGSTIELYCVVSCEEECLHENKLNHNGTTKVGKRGNDDKFKDLNDKAYYTLKIINATVKDSGVYQCLRLVWPLKIKGRREEIAGRKFHIQITDLRPTEHIPVVKVIFNGDGTFLPCVINTSHGVFPMPDRVEWRKDGRGLENGKDSYVTQDNSLLLTNLTTNTSCHCVVHWKDSGYNGSHYQLVVVDQPAAKHVNVYPKGIKAKVGERFQFVCNVSGFGWNYTVKWYSTSKPDDALATINHTHVLDIPVTQLNDSGSYYCKVQNEHESLNSSSSILQVIDPPRIISVTPEILIDVSTANNVILNCSFTGDLTHTIIYWIKGGRNLTDYTSIINNTAILNLSIDANNKTFLGSYQCKAENEAGYVSRTTRVLPKGLTSAPRNIVTSIEYYSIDNCSIIVSWDPPVFTGGLAIYCYKIEVSYEKSYSERNELLGDCLEDSSYSWDGCQYISEYTDIEFRITVMDEHKNERSKESRKKLDKPEIMLNLMVDCTDNNSVQVNWSLSTYPYNINEYCLNYSCGSMSKEMCYMDRTTNNASISGIPVHNTTCRFIVTAKRDIDWLPEPNSNIVSCRSPKKPVVTASEQKFNGNEGDKITCTATGYPVPDIVWLNNNGSVVNKSRPVNDSVTNIVSVTMTVRRSDAGNYTCFANNSAGNDTTIISIETVQSIPILILPENDRFTENSNITCTATGYPVPDIVWQNSDGTVVNKSRIKTEGAMATGVGNLFKMSVLMTIGKNDAGVYTCTANNSFGDDSRSINVSVTPIPFITVHIPENEKTSMLTEGDNIICTATGYPAPDIVWQNSDGSNSSRFITRSLINKISTVNITLTVRKSDVGVYKCIAHNSAGESVHTINITVQVAANISILQTEQAFEANESDKIICTAIGYPEPDIVWLNDDGSMVNKDRLISGGPMPTGVGSTYNVSVAMIVRRGDAGIYRCNASNSIGNDSYIFNITVNSVPILTISESELLDVVGEQTYRVNEGGNITCTATGYPVPDVVWLNNDRSGVGKNRLITTDPAPTGIGGLFNVSIILMIKSTDYGMYMCHANNSLGTKVSNISVTSNQGKSTNVSYIYLWLSSSLLMAVILFAIVLFIIKRRTRRMGYEPPPEILDTKVADFDESITDTPSRIEVFVGDDKSDCSSIREFDVENSKMLEEIMYKGDPVFTAISLTSITESTSNIMDNDIINRESSSHYYDSSSSSSTGSNSNAGNSVQAQQHYDSGNPIVDNDPMTNEGSAYNDI